MTCLTPAARIARVKPPGPGPTSTTVAPSSGPAARAMRLVRLRSNRKFWPSDLLALRPWARTTSRSGGSASMALISWRRRLRPLPKPGREPQGGDQAVGPPDALPGDVEGCAVVGRGADKWQTERHVHGVVEGDGLDGDERLIVVHRERHVIVFSRTRVEHRVGRKGASHVDPLRLKLSHRRCDDGHILAPEVASPATPPPRSGPASPACGLRPATASRGSGMPNRSRSARATIRPVL